MISRLLKIIGLFCKRSLYKKWYSAKETYNFEEPTNRSHPVVYSYIIYDIQEYAQGTWKSEYDVR